MNARRQTTRRGQMADWIDDLIPPSLQRAILSAVLLGGMARMGITVDQNGQVAKQVAASVEDVRVAVSNELARSYEARRKTWTLSNDIARIEAKIDRLKCSQPE